MKGFRHRANHKNVKHHRRYNRGKNTNVKTHQVSAFKTSLVADLASFMLTTDNVVSINSKYQSINRLITTNKSNYDCTKKVKTIMVDNDSKDTRISPLESDKYFWMFYILYYDSEEYNITRRTFKHEKNLKYTFIDKINKLLETVDMKSKDFKAQMKKYRFRPNDTINILGNNIPLSKEDFLFMCYMFNINVCLMKGKIIQYFLFNVESSKYNIIDINTKSITLEPATKITIESNDSYYETDNIDKPLKSISTYKLKDLQYLASVFSIEILKDTGKKKTKGDLYSEIVTKL